MLHNVDHQDCYVQHLMDMAQRFNITISEDVRNQHGAILVPKGGQLDGSLAEKICHHQLMQPLENYVHLHNQLTAQQLMNYYKLIFTKDKNFAMFNARWKLNELLESGCQYYQEFPVIKQKMTVLKVQMPDLFRQSLICAYVSLAIAKQMGASLAECRSVFLAGLTHDIGILHLDSELVQQKGEYTPEQWRAMHSHTSIAHKILNHVEGLPWNVAMAVLEHHEHFDGSGYPFAKHGRQLGMMGQIVGMADTCLALYKRDLAIKKLGFDSLLPVLQLNPDIYCRKVFKATVELIQGISWPVKRVYSDEKMQNVIVRLMLDNEAIHHDYTVIYGLINSIRPHLPNNKKAIMLNNMADRIHKCLLSSGILQSEHNEWMAVSSKLQHQEDYLAIERLEIMYNEVKWQIKQLKKLIFLLWEKHQFKQPELNKLVQHGLWQMVQYHKGNSEPVIQ